VRLLILLQTVNQWIHIVSFSVWIGSILFFLFVFAPSAHSLPPKPGIDILNRGRRSFQTLSWIAINLLLITGIFNFVFRGIPTGFAFGPSYYQILGIKLLLFLAMFLHHGFQTFKYAPRIALLSAQTTPDTSTWPEDLLYLWRKWFILQKINATLGPIVLLLALGLAKT
jgi:putative copper export protein